MEKIRLTQMVKSAGCAAKIFPNILNETLDSINWWRDENVIEGFGGKDDAGIYKITDDLFLIHTNDFFTPVVDDPYIFGMISASNSFSDVYAMGGKPINALNIVAFPQNEDIKILKEILAGGAEKAKEAECSIIGGHSVDIPYFLYGLAVNGIVNPSNIKKNDSAKIGDVLILTKALGTGILNNAVKYSSPDQKYIDSLINSMLRLNKNASILMVKHNASSCTDITGFGLAGHSMQMAKASNVVFVFEINTIPILDGTEWAIANNFLTRGDKSNRLYTKDYIKIRGKLNQTLEHLIYDPQTSGGLLISVPETNALQLLSEIRDNGDEMANIIGYVEKPRIENIAGTIILNF